MPLSVFFLLVASIEQLHESPKKERERAEKEKGHELGLMGLAAQCATLPNT